MVCPCGRGISLQEDPTFDSPVEKACACGRLLEIERLGTAWIYRGDVAPEGSVPVKGFSRELKSMPDARRYRFEILDAARRRIPVHIVFSPSASQAEVKHSDLKPLRLTGVATATQARRRWLEWFEAPRRVPGLRSGASLRT
jgi:hypothetical protein